MKTEIEYSKGFLRQYKKLYKNNQQLHVKVQAKIKLFQNNPFDSSLRSYKLKGRFNELFAFSIEQDLRIIYYWRGDIAVFIDIGTHDQVYN